MIDIVKLFTDGTYRDQISSLFTERVLPVIAGTGILILGVIFIVAGSKTGQTVISTTTKAAKAVGEVAALA